VIDYQDFRPPSAPVADQAEVQALVLAERGARFWAKCVDWLTLLGLVLGAGLVSVLTVPAMLAYRKAGGSATGLHLVAAAVMGLSLVLGGIALVVWNCIWLHQYGQTVGKRALGIRIVRSDGGRATLGRIFALRYLPVTLLGAIPYVGPLISLVDVLLIFRDSRQCMHDQIADTIVVKAG
jgi:uncharacterized RDD family membrane protein YckC